MSETCGELNGPWKQGFWFCVPGAWRSKSNFRRYKGRGGKDNGGWGEQRSFESTVAVLARAALPAGWQLGEHGGSVGSRPGVVVFIYVESLLDVSNLSKSALDALEGVVFWTDASVRYCASMGLRVRGGEMGVIGVAAVNPACSEAELAAAGAAIGDTTLAAWRGAV